jgi:hypothetical protein
VRAFPLVVSDPDDAFGLPTWPRWWQSRGIGEWSDIELSHWDHAIADNRNRGFIYALLYLVVTGTRR